MELVQRYGIPLKCGGLYWSYTRGLSLGCPLSPILGAFFLREVDEQLTAMGLFFVRFMDDIMVLTPTRWALQRAVMRLDQTFRALGLQKHPDKTFIGRIEKGFDYLGYRLWPDRLAVTEATVERFRARLTQLYEQERGGRHAAPPPRVIRAALAHLGNGWIPYPRGHASRASDIVEGLRPSPVNPRGLSRPPSTLPSQSYGTHRG